MLQAIISADFPKVPGFKKVGTLENGRKLYLDSSRIKWEGDGIRFYTLETDSSGAYTIYSMTSDCQTQVTREHGLRYMSGGSPAGQDAPHPPEPFAQSILRQRIDDLCAASLSARRFAGSFDPQKALLALFGDYNETLKAGVWSAVRLPEGAQFKDVAADYANRQGLATVEIAQAFRDDDQEKYVVVTRIVPLTAEGTKWGCGACASLLGGAIFVHQQDQWVVEAETKVFDIIGGHDRLLKIQPVEVGPRKLGLSLSGEVGYANLQIEYDRILIPSRYHLHQAIEVIKFDASGDESTCSARGWEQELCAKLIGRREFMPNPNGPYSFLQVTMTGTTYDRNLGKRRHADSMKTYELVNYRYQERG